MNLFALSGLSVAVSCAILVSVFLLFGKTKLHRSLMVFNIVVGVWGFGIFLIGMAKGESQALAAWTIAHMGGLFVGPTFYHFVTVFCGLRRRRMLAFAYLQGFFFVSLILGTDLPYHKTKFVRDLYYLDPNPPYAAAVGLYLFFVLLSYSELLRFLPSSKGRKRTQTLYTIFGFLFGFTGATFTFFPMYRLDFVYPSGNFGITIYCLILSYAILRHRLMDIHVVLRKSLAYTISAGLLTGLFVLMILVLTKYLSDAIGISSFIVTVMAALTIAFLFSPLKNSIQPVVDRVFSRSTYDYYSILQSTSRELLSTMDMKRIAGLVVHSLHKSLGLRHAVLLSARGERYESLYSIDPGGGEPNIENRIASALRSHSPLVRRAARGGVVVKEELPESDVQNSARESADELARCQCEVAAPILIDGDPKFMIMLGEKLSGDSFSPEDLKLIKTLANQSAIALKNAALFADLSSALERIRKEAGERSKAERALMKAAKDWRATFDSTREAILVLDGNNLVVRANRRASDFFGLTMTELPGMSFSGLFRGKAVKESAEALSRSAQSGSHEELELLVEGMDKWVNVTFDPVQPESGGGARGTVCTVRDVTEFKNMHDSILQAKNDWEESFDTINDAITIHDRDFNILRANRTAMEMLDLSWLQISRQKCYVSYHGTDCPPQGCPSCNTLKTGKLSVTELFEPHLDKYLEIKALPRFDEDGQLTGLIHVVRDITEKRKLQSQIVQSRKMESIGRLAGGVAHDFNNLLFAIIGYSELVLNELGEQSPQGANLKAITEAAERAASLTKQLLAFGRKQVLEMQPVDPFKTVSGMAQLLSRIIGEDIEMEIKGSGSIPTIKADPVQIEQVIMNLAVNARDAMPQGGRFVINTKSVKIDEAFVTKYENVRPGEYVLLAVSDSGEGMTAEVQEKIFEPFFTTKEVGKGTGLGLATVYGIVKQHNGHIMVSSHPGKGTTFKVYFPTYEGGDRRVSKKTRETSLPPGTETVMVVEDETLLRELVLNVLQPLGYRLHAAKNGEEALEAIRTHNGRIDLVITDVIMPKMNGKDMATRILKERPKIKVLYMSGYPDETIDKFGVLSQGEAFIQKPVTPRELARKVREVLDGAAAQ